MSEKRFAFILIIVFVFAILVMLAIMMITAPPAHATWCFHETAVDNADWFWCKTKTPTATAVHYTSTPAPTITKTAVPTSTKQNTPTKTAVPATSTQTRRPANTPAPTQTSIAQVTQTAVPTPTNEPVMLIPAFVKLDPVRFCNNTIPMGVAWMYDVHMPEYLRESFCINDGFYHSNSDHQIHIDNGAIPILREQSDGLNIAIDLASRNYAGDYKIGNEPDLASQDNMTPCETAVFINQVEAILNNGRSIYWNGFELSHLRETLACYKSKYNSLPSGVLGVHGYSIDAHFSGSLTRMIDSACSILRDAGKQNCEVIISEIAVCNTQENPGAKMTQWLNEIENDSRIEHVYWYTIHTAPGDWNESCNSRFWIQQYYDGETYYVTTESGNALYEFVTGVEFVPQPINLKQ